MKAAIIRYKVIVELCRNGYKTGLLQLAKDSGEKGFCIDVNTEKQE